MISDMQAVQIPKGKRSQKTRREMSGGYGCRWLADDLELEDQTQGRQELFDCKYRKNVTFRFSSLQASSKPLDYPPGELLKYGER